MAMELWTSPTPTAWKVNITNRPGVMEWVARVPARPGVERGLGYGIIDRTPGVTSRTGTKRAHATSGR